VVRLDAVLAVDQRDAFRAADLAQLPPRQLEGRSFIGGHCDAQRG